jgi:hypothetical protein
MAAPAPKRLEPVPDEDNRDDKKEQKEAPDKVVDAARGEVVEDGPKTIAWHELELTLPPELPAWFMFDMTTAEAEDDLNSFAVHAVRNLLTIDQWKKARDWAVEKQLSMESFTEIVDQVYAAYGLGPGESEASDSSSENAGS